MFKKVVAKDWAHLQKKLFSKTFDPAIRRHRSAFAFRGINTAGSRLTNSLTRLAPKRKRYATLEQNLLKQFKKYAFPHLIDTHHEWHWLSLAQHHGLPTRLMDWTYSPMVALHFATSELHNMHVDGAVWRINYAQAHSLLDQHHQNKLRKLGARVFTVESLENTIADLETLDGLSAPNRDVGIFFEPPSLDNRIVNQFAYFMVLSNPYLSVTKWLKQPHVAGRVDVLKIVIPAKLKWEVRDKLDQSNITERVLMPGLDGLCSWLRRHYKPR